MSSGHRWGDDKCELCGDKDWMADKYCAENPEVADQREHWLQEMRKQEHSEACSAS